MDRLLHCRQGGLWVIWLRICLKSSGKWCTMQCSGMCLSVVEADLVSDNHMLPQHFLSFLKGFRQNWRALSTAETSFCYKIWLHHRLLSAVSLAQHLGKIGSSLPATRRSFLADTVQLHHQCAHCIVRFDNGTE